MRLWGVKLWDGSRPRKLYPQGLPTRPVPQRPGARQVLRKSLAPRLPSRSCRAPLAAKELEGDDEDQSLDLTEDPVAPGVKAVADHASPAFFRTGA